MILKEAITKVQEACPDAVARGTGYKDYDIYSPSKGIVGRAFDSFRDAWFDALYRLDHPDEYR